MWSRVAAAGAALFGVVAFVSPRPATAEEFGGIEFPKGEVSFADGVVSYSLNDATDVESPYDNPERALGPPTEEAVALGNTREGDTPGELIVSFDDNRLVDIDGDDLYIFETGPSAEATKVAVSVDGDQWVDLGRIEGSTRGIDLAAKDADGPSYGYVRLRDIANGQSSDGPYGGPDIDAIGAIGSEAADDGGGGDDGGSENCTQQTGMTKEYSGTTFPQGSVSFVDQVVVYEPGAGVGDEYADPVRALSEPDDEGVALGVADEENDAGEIVLFFQNNALTDVDGKDLYIFEGGPTTEATFVEISAQGDRWYELGRVEGDTSSIDLAEYGNLPAGTQYRFVRLRADPEQDASDAPFAGPDLDAVGAIGSCDVTSETDSDSDGTPDPVDACPFDPDISSENADANGQQCDWPVESGGTEGIDDLVSGCGCRAAGGPIPGGALFAALVALLVLRRRN